MRICVDFDHTLCETSKALLKTYNDYYNDNIKYNPDHYWNLKDLVPDKYAEWTLDQFNHKYLFKNMTMIDNCEEILKKLYDEGNEIYIITNHSGHALPYKEQKIKKHFPYAKLVFVDSFDKSITFGDIFIDDKIESLNSVLNNYQYVWCFGNYKWNENWEGIRFTNWNNIYDEIKKIKDDNYEKNNL